MGILFWGLLLFCSALLFHLIVWRVHKPKRQTKILLLLFSCTFIVGTLALCGISSLAASFSLFPLTNVIEYFHLLLFFTTLTLGYVVTYSAIEADSPSLIMVSIIANEGPGGLDEKKFTQLLTDDLLVKPRVDDLIRDNFAYIDGDKYRLTRKGLSFVRVFILWRKLMKLPKGG